MNVTIKRCVAVLGILVVTATTAGAQQAHVGPKWLAWTGCWTASPPGESAFLAAPSSGPTVCITPSSSGDAADFTTIDSGKVVSTQHIDASGVEGPVDATGCTGVQRASWSADERRIYLRSASTCNGAKSTTSAILAISASGEWLDIHDVKSYGNDNVRVARYRDAGIPAGLPAQIASALHDRGSSAESARMAAGGDIGPTAVIEASRAADSLVVAAWLMEREQHFNVDAKTLVQLAEAGVPGGVTDVLVAASNPGVFQFARAQQQEDERGTTIYTDAGERRRVSAMGVPYDPWSWGYLGYGYPIGYGYGSLGYGRYGYGSYGGYGYGSGGYYGGYVPPIVIVTNGQAQSRGQMVKGRGYTQTQGSSSGTASERPRSTYTPPPPSSSASGSSATSGSSASSGSSSSSSGSGRTAKPRP
jgi:hypothetical protein